MTKRSQKEALAIATERFAFTTTIPDIPGDDWGDTFCDTVIPELERMLGPDAMPVPSDPGQDRTGVWTVLWHKTEYIFFGSSEEDCMLVRLTLGDDPIRGPL